MEENHCRTGVAVHLSPSIFIRPIGYSIPKDKNFLYRIWARASCVLPTMIAYVDAAVYGVLLFRQE